MPTAVRVRRQRVSRGILEITIKCVSPRSAVRPPRGPPREFFPLIAVSIFRQRARPHAREHAARIASLAPRLRREAAALADARLWRVGDAGGGAAPVEQPIFGDGALGGDGAHGDDDCNDDE